MIGRVLTGVGAAGVLVVGSIIVIQMASAQRRGLFLGLINSGVTVGVSLGAVIAGAVAPKFGWVSSHSFVSPLLHRDG
jgi:MFS family permease